MYWISARTGEQISFTGDQKIIWVWMCSRFHFFNDSGREWFDNQEDIAIATGTSESTVKRFMALLSKHGYLEVKKRRRQGFIQSNSYTILRGLELGSPASASTRVSVTTPAPMSVPDEPEERIPPYAPIVHNLPAPPRVNLTSRREPVVLEVLEVAVPVIPKVKLTHGTPAWDELEPDWKVHSSS
ncbi:DUF6945 domain-containing protein [Pseudomonas sp. TE12234]